MKKLAAFDLDEVLADTGSIVLDIMHEATGKHIAFNEWHTYDLGKLYSLTPAQVRRLFIEHRLIERVKPSDGAEATLQYFRTRGYKTAVVTARDWHPAAVRITGEWLKEHRLPVDELTVVADDKSDMLKRLAPDVYVDDLPTHVSSAAKAGVRCPVLMTKPWNRRCPRLFYRVGSLPELTLGAA